MSSSDKINLSRDEKANALVSRYGMKGFDYVGNSGDDLAVFKHCRRGFLVSSNERLRREASRRNEAMTFVGSSRGGLRAWVKVLRVHQ